VGHSAVAFGGSAVIFGGRRSPSQALADSWVFNIDAAAWRRLPTAAGPSCSGAGGPDLDGLRPAPGEGFGAGSSEDGRGSLPARFRHSAVAVGANLRVGWHRSER
jgi:Galactose oxidase, central domain